VDHSSVALHMEGFAKKLSLSIANQAASIAIIFGEKWGYRAAKRWFSRLDGVPRKAVARSGPDLHGEMHGLGRES